MARLSTTDQLLSFIRSHYQAGEPLPAKRANAAFRYQGIGTYRGQYEHLQNEPVVIIHSDSAESRPEVKLFPEILLTLLHAYPDMHDRGIIDSLNNRLKDFLKSKGAPTDFPNLYTDESYYAAMTRSLHEKLRS